MSAKPLATLAVLLLAASCRAQRIPATEGRAPTATDWRTERNATWTALAPTRDAEAAASRQATQQAWAALSTEAAGLPHSPPATCPITRPPQPAFIPPPPWSPQPPSPGEFWYGTDSLWTAIPEDAAWHGMPHNPGGWTQKVFWWRKGYVWDQEPNPQLSMTARRLDGSAPSIAVSGATNAFAQDIQSAMLVGVDFPTLGCWQLTGSYRGSELTFVVWLAP